MNTNHIDSADVFPGESRIEVILVIRDAGLRPFHWIGQSFCPRPLQKRNFFRDTRRVSAQ